MPVPSLSKTSATVPSDICSFTASFWCAGVEPPSGTSYTLENWLSVKRALRKKPVTDTEVLFSRAKKPAQVKTSALGDASLLQRAGGIRPLENRVGLDRAYQQGDSYTRNTTMYVAGSHTARDWYDDVTKIPF